MCLQIYWSMGQESPFSLLYFSSSFSSSENFFYYKAFLALDCINFSLQLRYSIYLIIMPIWCLYICVCLVPQQIYELFCESLDLALCLAHSKPKHTHTQQCYILYKKCAICKFCSELLTVAQNTEAQKMVLIFKYIKKKNSC